MGDNIDSDHHPIIVRIKGGDKIRLGRKERTSKKWVWTQEGKDEFRKALGNVEEVAGEVEEVWETMRDRIKQVMRGGCAAKGIRRERGWWDRECKEEKSIVRKELRRWREKGGDGKCYREAKGKYKKLIEGKKKEEKERWEREVREIKTVGQVWELVNRGRRRRRKVNEDISMEEWDGYFRNLLGGGEGFKIDEEESISRSEIRAVIGRLKDNKAVGTDGIPAEIWKYGGENMEV
ncbi:hypothetical protein ACFW04_006875 [Cataglyphis niger]